jgi:hypothetical protein
MLMKNNVIQVEKLPNNDQIIIDYNNEIIKCYYLHQEKKLLLADIDNYKKITIIHPLITRIESPYLLHPKHDVDFLFEGYNINVEESSTEKGINIVSGLPKVCIRTLRYGLGLKKEYRFIAEIADHLEECNLIIVSKKQRTEIDKKNIIINHDDLDKIRRGMDRIIELYRNESVTSRELFVYNELLHNNNKELFPRKKKDTHRDIIYRIVKDNDFSKSMSKSVKTELLKIKDEIDFNYFKKLYNEFAKIIDDNKNESAYQNFFEENPLLLTLFIGSPYIQLNNQAYIGGKSFDNKNGQYPDFLFKHKMTNNSFLIEIKCPNTPLLEKTPYRETGIYSPSKELSGAISQVLTQKYQLETEIATLLKNAEDRNVEAYNVQGFIIIGLLSNYNNTEDNAKLKKRSFELFRNNQKNLRIMTYDECQEQLNYFIQGMDIK